MFVCLCVCHFSVVCSCLLCVISEEHLALVKRLVEVFDRALEQITKLLTFDSLPRFLRSPEFQQFCETFNDAHQQKPPPRRLPSPGNAQLLTDDIPAGGQADPANGGNVA